MNGGFTMAVDIKEMRGKDNPPETKGVMSMKDFLNHCTAYLIVFAM